MIQSLCETCGWMREVTTPRSRFLLCELSKMDPAYAKYPPQPVVRCEGHQQKVTGMDPMLRVVMRIPMSELWDSAGNLTAAKQRSLGGSDVAALLRQGQVRFVVAECGDPLRWIPLSRCYDFWKTELKPRIVETETFDQAGFPGAYCYVASEWTDDQSSPLVLLEMYH